jgi:hypothetical protein
MFGIIVAFVFIIIVVVLLNNKSNRHEKLTRIAIQKLAKEVNREIRFYDLSNEINVVVLDYIKESRKESIIDIPGYLRNLVDTVNNHEDTFVAIVKYLDINIEKKITEAKVEIVATHNKSNNRKK